MIRAMAIFHAATAYEAGLQRVTDAKEKYYPSRNVWQSPPATRFG